MPLSFFFFSHLAFLHPNSSANPLRVPSDTRGVTSISQNVNAVPSGRWPTIFFHLFLELSETLISSMNSILPSTYWSECVVREEVACPCCVEVRKGAGRANLPFVVVYRGFRIPLIDSGRLVVEERRSAHLQPDRKRSVSPLACHWNPSFYPIGVCVD